jgi:flagellar basal-body rod modification protein FlgD
MTSSEMAVAHAASTGGAGATATPENPGAVLGQNDFLKLMIAQLQAQDPLQPANTNEYVSELAQFTQVEQTTNIAASSQLAGAVQLIGHTISYNNGLGETVKGVVQSVQSGSPPTITVEGVAEVKIASVVEVN